MGGAGGAGGMGGMGGIGGAGGAGGACGACGAVLATNRVIGIGTTLYTACRGGYPADFVRPRRSVVGPVLTAALALVALPGLAGSHATTVQQPLPAGAFQPLTLPATGASSPLPQPVLDAAFVSDDQVSPADTFREPGTELAGGPDARTSLDQPDAGATEDIKPPLYTLTGTATFYHAGSTAMRLPRGTVVVICGDDGCIERVINDYGPVSESRIVDMYVDDFFQICGCPSWSGLTEVTVSVY